MKKILFTIMALAAGALCLAAAPEKKLFTKHFNQTLFDISKNGKYSVEFLLNNKEYDIGNGTTGIVVHNDKDQDVYGAHLDVVMKNLEGGPDQVPTDIKDQGNGAYIVYGLEPEKPGKWELDITVDKDGVKDSVSFPLPEALQKKPYPAGRYSP
jgi:hypothetical protein